MIKDYRITRHPILLGTVIVWTGWLILMITGNDWHLRPNGLCLLRWVFGSFIAGATSEGVGRLRFQ